ncbi:MAG: ABC transporter ATP-binding protein/permease [Anaerolineae bacterium]|nr:ABC transporter ATP-binding protein/permease [Anaerolineae bacterium]
MNRPRFDFNSQGSKARDSQKTLRTLLHYLAPYHTKVIIVIVFAALSSIFSIVGPKLLGNVTTKLAEGLIAYYYRTGLYMDFAYMGRLIVLLIILYSISMAFSYAQSFIMSGVSMQVTYNLRKQIDQKISRLPLKYYDTTTHGEVLSRVTNDVDMISQSLNQSLAQLITSVATVIGVLVMMLSINLLMTLAAVVTVSMSFGLIGAIVKTSQSFFRAQQEALGKMNGHVEEMYGGHAIVEAFNRQDESIQRFYAINDTLCDSAWKSQFFTSIMQPMMQFVGNVGYVIVCILGGYLAVKKVIEIGDIQSFIQYMRNFTAPITQLASISNTLQQTIAASERVFEFLDEPEESAERNLVSANEVRGDVSFEHMAFGYDAAKPIIHDFSASVLKGEKVAIVGPTGAGKSTIVKLLMRFYDINSGDIKIDGHSIFDYTRNDLRSIFGMVLQDTWLYNASIFENIRYGTFNATRDQVLSAAKAAHCDEFIHTLPQGYDTILNEESGNISQGQKQLLTIARVILADPKILILDEATSSIDTRTEILIQKAMDTLMKGRTSFIIAHRLSTIKNADLILVLNNGDVIEQGNHVDLLAAGGFYAGMYNSQFERRVMEYGN